MTDNANCISNNSSCAPVLEAREDLGSARAPCSDRLSSVRDAAPSDRCAELAGLSRNEDTNVTLKRLLAEYQERSRQQDRELKLLRQQFDGALVVQDRLGLRLSELASFALLAYRGSPIQVFPNLYEILDGMFTRLYEATIRVHGMDKEAALTSLESLMSRLEMLQSFLRRTEAASRFFVGDESGRRQNERFLLGNIPPQVNIPAFDSTLERTRLPFPNSRHSSFCDPVTPPNTPVDRRSLSSNPRKRTRTDDIEEGEIPTKRRC
ncbi:hypothetical protein K435DRAFT_807232 [Dendrothele bispora CBS 962.96]|uniref:Uncharacterized protein n=1 Tax=Dendrothele bispora (strain CBS 962.96) TaxID=1314807 RepID=A0A4S8L5D0_DENBC|nr:hypothetical protein K435DRAFT_807231 [Dendrothele bispora CBS 962.96]THU83802.1 hypothetical protein K435DRAFT_807232 [Dendrothele bispora CBS 962.96]